MLDASDPKLRLTELLTKYEAAGGAEPGLHRSGARRGDRRGVRPGWGEVVRPRLKNRAERRCGFSGKPS